MSEDTSDRKLRHEKAVEVAGEIAEKVGDLVKQEREFLHTGVLPPADSLGSLAEGAVGAVLKDLVNLVAEIAEDELVFRHTGQRPTHNTLEELQAKAAAAGPPRGALARARAAEELGISPEQPTKPFLP